MAPERTAASGAICPRYTWVNVRKVAAGEGEED
jgi:hypothetical protein